MDIKLWYSKDMKKWRWTFVDPVAGHHKSGQHYHIRDAMDDMRKRDEYREQMNFKREEAAQKNAHDQAKLNVDREKLATQREIANKNLEIARENKNRYDVESAKKKSDQKKKK